MRTKGINIMGRKLVRFPPLLGLGLETYVISRFLQLHTPNQGSSRQVIFYYRISEKFCRKRNLSNFRRPDQRNRRSFQRSAEALFHFSFGEQHQRVNVSSGRDSNLGRFSFAIDGEHPDEARIQLRQAVLQAGRPSEAHRDVIRTLNYRTQGNTRRALGGHKTRRLWIVAKVWRVRRLSGLQFVDEIGVCTCRHTPTVPLEGPASVNDTTSEQPRAEKGGFEFPETSHSHRPQHPTPGHLIIPSSKAPCHRQPSVSACAASCALQLFSCLEHGPTILTDFPLAPQAKAVDDLGHCYWSARARRSQNPEQGCRANDRTPSAETAFFKSRTIEPHPHRHTLRGLVSLALTTNESTQLRQFKLPPINQR
ncbi:hypothetical protein VTK26DRAFT_4699 [Humicola hyalothermophila]